MTDTILTAIIEKGTTFAMLVWTILFLTKKVLTQYEERIKDCEAENKECRDDRKELHSKIEHLRQEQIAELKAGKA